MEKPTLPKGTRDFGPEQMARRQFIFDHIKKTFQRYGFQPLETPAMESLSTLTGKYGDEGDQLIFRILNSGDFLGELKPEDLDGQNSKLLAPKISEKGLRYDLTVPFARYVVMNRHEITFPFRRYQLQPVWRADRPQKGRYREFYQCDADVVGTNSLLCETEIILMIRQIFAALKITNYTIRINHRDVLAGLAAHTGASDKASSLFLAMDKLDKIGEEKVRDELTSRGFDAVGLERLFEALSVKGTSQQKLAFLSKSFASLTAGLRGVTDLEEILRRLADAGESDDRVQVDLSLARGLSYYTGTIFEVTIHDVAVGSVSGGGRYDNLTGVFGLPDVSGVGISFGVDRIYDALDELKLFPKETQGSSTLLMTCMDEEGRSYGLRVAQAIRAAGVTVETYPDIVKLKKQLEYADKKKIPYVIVIGSREVANSMVTLKNMATGDQQEITLDQLATFDFTTAS